MFRRRKPDDTKANQVGQPSPNPGTKPPAAPPAGAAATPAPGAPTAASSQVGSSTAPSPTPAGSASIFNPTKDSPSMGRAPFPSAPGNPAAPNQPQGSVPPGAPTGAQAAPPPGLAGLAGQRPQAAAPRREEDQRRTLVVGRGISVQGSVQDAERLVVEGTVESSMIAAKELSVAPGGLFRGGVEVEDAEIAGTVDGTLTVRGSLTVSSTGRLLGKATCKRLRVEDGGQITGQLEMMTESGNKPTSASTPAATPAPSSAA